MRLGLEPAILLKDGMVVGICTGADFATEHEQGIQPFLSCFTNFRKAGTIKKFMGLIKSDISLEELPLYPNAVRQPIEHVNTIQAKQVSIFGGMHRINDTVIMRISLQGPFKEPQMAANHYLNAAKAVGKHLFQAGWDPLGFFFIYKGPLISEVTQFVDKVNSGKAMVANRCLYNQSVASLKAMGFEVITRNPDTWQAEGITILEVSTFADTPAFKAAYT